MGGTPLVRLNKVTEGVDATVLLKCEFFNPGGSIKDRIGWSMVEDAEAKGRINILRKIINFDEIAVNQNQKAKEEDLKYFKSSFERIFFDENFLDMFEISKIKKFILDIT